MSTHNIEVLLMRTQKICFCGEIRKISITLVEKMTLHELCLVQAHADLGDC